MRRALTRRPLSIFGVIASALVLWAIQARASSYVVYLPLDSTIYRELEALEDAGAIDTYFLEVKPISRIEAARLTLEAETRLDSQSGRPFLVRSLTRSLRMQLKGEIGWLESSGENRLHTELHPVDRIESQYVFSSGRRRRNHHESVKQQIEADEGTPLLSDNDDLPTASGSNEVARVAGWGGVGGFLTAYGEGAAAGPLTHGTTEGERLRLLRGEVVADFGNLAVSWGLAEMKWGVGRFGSLSQSANAQPFPALRLQNVYPFMLPGPLKYLGIVRAQGFLGQLDHDRPFSRPWISGQIIALKPLPFLELGFTHAIDFGGKSNDRYTFAGFLGRATGLSTGQDIDGRTNSRGSLFVKLTVPQLRRAQIYFESLGEDNIFGNSSQCGVSKSCTTFPLAHFMPFEKVSFRTGVYVPQLTSDGRTTAGFEFASLDPYYSVHSDSLYWTYRDRFMGDPVGPASSRFQLWLGRWLQHETKLDVGLSYTSRTPKLGIPGLRIENGEELSLELWTLQRKLQAWGSYDLHLRGAVEYVQNMNYQPEQNAVRTMLQLSGSFSPEFAHFVWR